MRDDYARSNQSIKSNCSQHYQISDHAEPLRESSVETPTVHLWFEYLGLHYNKRLFVVNTLLKLTLVPWNRRKNNGKVGLSDLR